MSSQRHLVASPALSSNRQPRLPLLMRALHPIRRHYTPSVRVHRDVTGASPHRKRTTSQRMKHHATGGSPPLVFRTPTTTVEMLPCENADVGRRRPRLEVPTSSVPMREPMLDTVRVPQLPKLSASQYPHNPSTKPDRSSIQHCAGHFLAGSSLASPAQTQHQSYLACQSHRTQRRS